FPVVEYSPLAANIIPGTPARRSWQDFLVKYIHKRDPDGNLIQYKNGSPIWGCPSYDGDNFWANVDPGTASFNPTTPQKFATGYGMSRFAMAPYYTGADPVPQNFTRQIAPGTYAVPGNVALIRDPNPIGSFIKMEKWGVR